MSADTRRDARRNFALGPTRVAWIEAPDLVGVIQWGTLDERDLCELFTDISRIRGADGGAIDSALIDCREVDGFAVNERLDFGALCGMRQASLRVRQIAVIVPPGITGILLTGALIALAPTSQLRFAYDLASAVETLDRPSASDAHVAALEVARAACGPSFLLARVRAHLVRNLVGATIGDCAAALGLSSRGLQRALKSAASSFSNELRRLRVQEAAGLLRFTDAKIDVVATRVGFCGASRMTSVLRRDLDVGARELRAGKRRRSNQAS